MGHKRDRQDKIKYLKKAKESQDIRYGDIYYYDEDVNRIIKRRKRCYHDNDIIKMRNKSVRITDKDIPDGAGYKRFKSIARSDW